MTSERIDSSSFSVPCIRRDLAVGTLCRSLGRECVYIESAFATPSIRCNLAVGTLRWSLRRKCVNIEGAFFASGIRRDLAVGTLCRVLSRECIDIQRAASDIYGYDIEGNISCLDSVLCGSRNIESQYSQSSWKPYSSFELTKGMGKGIADTCPTRQTAKATSIVLRMADMEKISNERKDELVVKVSVRLK
jgi:hypothetical protein